MNISAAGRPLLGKAGVRSIAAEAYMLVVRHRGAQCENAPLFMTTCEGRTDVSPKAFGNRAMRTIATPCGRHRFHPAGHVVSSNANEFSRFEVVGNHEVRQVAPAKAHGV